MIKSDDIKEFYLSIGETVPFQFVDLPYVEIQGDCYAVVPVGET